MKKTDILDVVSRKLSPYIFLFGFYLVSYGHISPGGGFQGGVVIASGVILLALSHDVSTAESFFPASHLTVLETAAYSLVLFAGLLGVLLGVGFLGNFLVEAGAGAPATTGTPATAVAFGSSASGSFSPFPAGGLRRVGFIFLLNVLIGVKVAAGVSLICIHLFRSDSR